MSWRQSGIRLAVDSRGEIGKELLRKLFGAGIDQPRTELRDLPADLRLGFVLQNRLVAVFLQHDVGPTFGKAGDPAFSLTGDRIAFRSIDVGKLDLAVEGCGDRADLELYGRGQFRRRNPIEALTAGNACAQDFGIVQRLPHSLTRGSNALLAGHIHIDRLSRR